MHRSTALRLGMLAVVIVLGAGAAYESIRRISPQPNPDPNHTHANFAVWINGNRWDFAQPKYMSEAPASGSGVTLLDMLVPSASAHGGHEEGDVIPERKYLHLHDGNGSVIHRHKPGLPLSQFFTSLGWQMTNVCMVTDTHESYCNDGDKKWRMFVNSQEQLMNPYFVFADGDQILLTYGSTKDEMQAQMDALGNDACLYSQTCPWRGKAPTENCIADPAIPCVL